MENQDFKLYIVTVGENAGRRFTGNSIHPETVWNTDAKESEAYNIENVKACTCSNHQPTKAQEKEYCEYHDFTKWPFIEGDVVYGSLEEATRTKPTRPDLSILSVKPLEVLQLTSRPIHCSKMSKFENVALIRDGYEYLTIKTDTNRGVKEFNALMVAIENIPALIQIAEMYYDSMKGNPAEKGLPFQITSKTLKALGDGIKE